MYTNTLHPHPTPTPTPHPPKPPLTPQVPLSARGWEQAVACGNSLRAMMQAEHGANYKLFFMTSPYCRTRQTFVGIRQAFPDENFAGVQVGYPWCRWWWWCKGGDWVCSRLCLSVCLCVPSGLWWMQERGWGYH